VPPHHTTPQEVFLASFCIWDPVSVSQFLPCVAFLPVLLLSSHSSASAATLHPWCAAAQLPGASCAATSNDRFPLYYCYYQWYYSNCSLHSQLSIHHSRFYHYYKTILCLKSIDQLTNRVTMKKRCNNNNHFTALVWDYPGEPVPEETMQ